MRIIRFMISGSVSFLFLLSVVFLDGMDVKQKESLIQKLYVPLSEPKAISGDWFNEGFLDMLYIPKARLTSRTVVHDKLLAVGVRSALAILNMKSKTIERYAIVKPNAIPEKPIDALCLLNGTDPLIALENEVYHLMCSKDNKLCRNKQGFESYQLEAKESFSTGFLDSEKIIILERTESYLIAVSSKGSLVTWPINGDTILKNKQVNYTKADEITMGFPVALDKQRELVFIGLNCGKVAIYTLSSDKVMPKIIQIFGINKQITCIDLYADKIAFGTFCCSPSHYRYRCCKDHMRKSYGRCRECIAVYDQTALHTTYTLSGTENQISNAIAQMRASRASNRDTYIAQLCDHMKMGIEEKCIPERCNCCDNGCRNVLKVCDVEALCNSKAENGFCDQEEINLDEKIRDDVNDGDLFYVFTLFLLPDNKLFVGKLKRKNENGLHDTPFFCIISYKDGDKQLLPIKCDCYFSVLYPSVNVFPIYGSDGTRIGFNFVVLHPFTNSMRFSQSQEYRLDGDQNFLDSEIKHWYQGPYALSTITCCCFGLGVLGLVVLYKTLNMKAQQ